MIDFDFIATLEGKGATHGYVPDPQNSNSGVTIATGFDLGARNINDLRAYGFAQALIDQLSPYCGLKKHSAADKLAERPLSISHEEVETIDHAVNERLLNTLQSRYNADADEAFDTLPDGCQTVIASVEFQYGSIKSKAPNFWRQVTTQDWQGAYKNLKNFGDKYATRRHKEATLWQQAVSKAGLGNL